MTHQWTEGDDLPGACAHMAFLDTASARLYVEDKTEILFLPPEVRCLTILGQLYGLASQRCQTAADQLSQAHGGADRPPPTPTPAAGTLEIGTAPWKERGCTDVSLSLVG